jgi:hypothetical protein
MVKKMLWNQARKLKKPARNEKISKNDNRQRVTSI